MVLIFTALISVVLFNTLIRANKSIFLSFIWTIISVYSARYVFAARNQIFSFLVFILELYSLQELLERGKKRYCA